MAELLKRKYDIVVLKVQLRRLKSGDEEVSFKVQYSPHGIFTEGPAKVYPAESICKADPRVADRSTSPQSFFQLPQDMLEELASWMNAECDYGQPLWVHLVSPYGLLRFVAWEEQLGHALGRPILMLPDFLFRQPREAARSIDIVICCSAPASWEEHHVQRAIAEAIYATYEIERDRVTAHIFVDHPTRAMVEHALYAAPRPSFSIQFYSPVPSVLPVQLDELSYAEDDLSLKTSWLDWIKLSLKGKSVDVVHFICHGYLSDRRGGLQFSKYPLEGGLSKRATPVNADEVTNFLTQLGAWSTVFTSLEDNVSPLGLRALADEIAQTRPGPMMMCKQGSTGLNTLAEAYRFLFSAYVPTPPQSPGLFIYCQPALAALPTYLSDVTEETTSVDFTRKSLARNSEQERVANLVSSESFYEPLYQTAEDVPLNIAATERFAEQVELRYQKLARDEVVSSDSTTSVVDTVFETVNKLRSAVASLNAKGGL
ncbi:hypothetical protein ACG02S_26010 [Roseateles sp. DC23W]|uniref:CHAT domain-containing protein n=1 Tax=Pelomonas dachongensis TaxID=3299029 RepID=A0ABW7EV54_9BURK